MIQSMHRRPFKIAVAISGLLASATAGCATWHLGASSCVGPDVAPEEYDAYALYMRERIDVASLIVSRQTLTDDAPAPGGKVPPFSDPDARRLREVEEQHRLRNQIRDTGPQWRQAIAEYESRSAAGGCLARVPTRAPAGLSSAGGTRTLSFSRVGFDAAKTVAVFEVELTGPLPGDAEGGVVRLIKTPDRGWLIREGDHWIAERPEQAPGRLD